MILVSMNVAPVGGLTNDVLKCVRAMRQNGREVHVIYGFRGKGTLEAVADDAVNWHRVRMLKRPPVIGQIMFWLTSKWIIRKVRQHAPNAKAICFERLPLGDATIGTAPHALWMKVRKQMGLSPFSKIPYTLWCNWMDSIIQKHPSRPIVLFSQRDRQALMERGVAESRLHRVIIPTDTSRFRPAPDSERSYITIIGANPRLKGVDLALNAWPAIHARHPELKLRIVTQGWKVRQMVEKSGLDGVEIAPFIKDVESYYHQSRVVLMPSLFETWGNVVPEALACGVPVVASSGVPSSELITGDEMGALFHRDRATDLQEISDAIEHALTLNMDTASMENRHSAVESFMRDQDDLTSWLRHASL